MSVTLQSVIFLVDISAKPPLVVFPLMAITALQAVCILIDFLLLAFFPLIYIDVQGNIMIWDSKNPEHPVKFEKRSFPNGLFDIGWTDDSKRICCVGGGTQLFVFFSLL